MMVMMYVNFNGREVLVTGTVIDQRTNDEGKVEYIVDFHYNGVDFRGIWTHGKLYEGGGLTNELH